MKTLLLLLAFASVPAFAAGLPDLKGVQFTAVRDPADTSVVTGFVRWVPDGASSPACYFLTNRAYELFLNDESTRGWQDLSALGGKYVLWPKCPDGFGAGLTARVQSEAAFSAKCLLPLDAQRLAMCRSGAVVWKWSVKANGIYPTRPAYNLAKWQGLVPPVWELDGRSTVGIPCDDRSIRKTTYDYHIAKNTAGKDVLVACTSVKVTLP